VYYLTNSPPLQAPSYSTVCGCTMPPAVGTCISTVSSVNVVICPFWLNAAVSAANNSTFLPAKTCADWGDSGMVILAAPATKTTYLTRRWSGILHANECNCVNGTKQHSNTKVASSEHVRSSRERQATYCG